MKTEQNKLGESGHSSKKVSKTEAQWREQLSPEAYAVCRQHGTEAPFSGALLDEKRSGLFTCACCGAELFSSNSKYDSGSGWPSFYEKHHEEAVAERFDDSHGMRRTEVLCARCDSHLGHVFPDGPPPTGLRYCINSLSLGFEPVDEVNVDDE